MPQFLAINLSERPRIAWAGSDTVSEFKRSSFRLKDVWCLHYYKYSGRIVHNGSEECFQPGSIGICEPYAKISYDDISGDKDEHLAFNFHLREPVGEFQWRIPLIVQPGTGDIDDALKRFERTIQLYLEIPMSEPVSLKAEVELWALLLAFAEDSVIEAENSKGRRQGQLHVRKALKIIDAEINTDIYAGKIAEDLGISISQLGRLFNEHLGCPVATFIRRKRLKYAYNLLAYYNTPIRQVADSIGMGDLANFNRFIRREFGQSPKQIRARERDGLKVIDTDSDHPFAVSTLRLPKHLIDEENSEMER
ncbi:MAG: AraC family transcriptional regulator [Verrucomicrobiota bacterium]